MSDDDDLEAAVARLAALEAVAVERQARDRERAEKPFVRTPPSLAEADRRQKARERAEKVLRDAELTAPDDFDPVGMWEEIEKAFRIADLRARAATVPSKADIAAAIAVQKAAQTLADATAEIFKRDHSAGLAVARRLRHLRKTAMPNSAASEAVAESAAAMMLASGIGAVTA